MSPDIDWNNFKEQAERASMIPDKGRYMLKCISAEWTKTKDGIKDMMVLRHRLVDEPEFDDFDILTFQTYSPESRFAIKMFNDMLEAHQVDPVADADGDSNTVAEMLVGREVYGDVDHDEWNGQIRPRIRAFETA